MATFIDCSVGPEKTDSEFSIMWEKWLVCFPIASSSSQDKNTQRNWINSKIVFFFPDRYNESQTVVMEVTDSKAGDGNYYQRRYVNARVSSPQTTDKYSGCTEGGEWQAGKENFICIYSSQDLLSSAFCRIKCQVRH